MSSDDESLKFVRIGESLLDQVYDDNVNLGNKPSDSLYRQTIDLSDYLRSKSILFYDNASISDTERQEILKKVEAVLKELNRLNKEPTYDIGPGNSIFEAYKVVSFALLAIRGECNNGNIQNKYNKLKSKYRDLQKQYNHALENHSDSSFLSSFCNSINDVHGNLSSENSALMAENQRLQDQIDLLQEKVLEQSPQKVQDLLSFLIVKYNLPNNTDIDNVISNLSEATYEGDIEHKYQEVLANTAILESQIESLKNENKTLATELEMVSKVNKEFNNKFTEIKHSSDFDNEASDAKIFTYETEISALKLRVKELTTDNGKKKQKLKAIAKAFNELEESSSKKEIEIEDLKMRLDKLSMEYDELANAPPREDTYDSIQKLAFKQQEIIHLHHAIDDLSTQMEQMNNELEKESDIKNKLTSLLHKQGQALSVVEEMNRSLKEQIAEAQKQPEIIEKTKEVLVDCNHLEVINAIKDVSKDQQVLRIAEDEDLSVIDRICDIITILEKRPAAEPHNDQLQQKQRLITYVSNMLHFIDQIANSSEIQNWLIESSYEENFRIQLLAQCSRVESFMEQHDIDLSQTNDFTSFIEFPNYLKQNIEEIQGDQRELLLVAQYCFLVNDILRKYSTELCDQLHHVSSDLQRIKYELKQQNDSSQDQIFEATSELNDSLHNLREKCNNQEKLIQRINRHLQNSKNDEAVAYCLNLINGNIEEEEVNEDDEPEKEVRILRKKLAKALQELAVSQEESQQNQAEAKKLIRELKKALKDQKKIIESGNHEYGDQMTEMNDTIQQLTSANQKLQSLATKQAEEIEEKQRIISSTLDQIEQLRSLHAEELQNLEADLNSKNRGEYESLLDEIDKLKHSFESNEADVIKQERNKRHQMKSEIRQLKSELALQTQRNKEIRDHFDPLLNELREKLAESRACESELNETLKRKESELQETKAALSSTRIDFKMLELKSNSLQEKMNREKALLETQHKMKIMGLETDHQKDLEQTKSEFIQQNHKFLVSICEEFKEFVDFNQPITEDNVKHVINLVSNEFSTYASKVREYEKLKTEINTIRGIIGLEKTTPFLPAITGIIQEAREYQRKKKQIDDNTKEIEEHRKLAIYEHTSNKSGREWEQWAKRVYALISDSYTTPKTSNDLQYSLEEALVGSIGQRLLNRRIEILRIEKSILASGALQKVRRTSRPVNVKCLILVLSAIMKMEKVSGHMKFSLISTSRKSEPIDRSGRKQKKDYPIIDII